MMPWFIQVWGLGSGASLPYVGQFLQAGDVEAHDGRGDATFVRDLPDAKQFASAEEAMGFWSQPSATRPLREDGQPNRPLTAFTVVFFEAELPPPDAKTVELPEIPALRWHTFATPEGVAIWETLAWTNRINFDVVPDQESADRVVAARQRQLLDEAARVKAERMKRMH